MTPHGAPDWSKYRRDSVSHAVEDLSELAVRLGSIDRHDRRGDVVLMEDFEYGLSHAYTATSGTGAAVALDPTRALNGGYSLKLTGGSDADKTAEVHLKLPRPTGTKVGLEVAFHFATAFAYLFFELAYYDGTNRHLATTIYSYGDQEWAIYDENGDWTTIISSVAVYVTESPFYVVKLVVDPDNDLYTRLLANEQESDLSSYGLQVAANNTDPHLDCVVTLQGRAGQNDYVRIDNVIVTRDEP